MKLPRLEVGDPITADFLNALVDAANRATLSVGPNSGLVLVQGTDGMVLATALPGFFWAKTTGGISGGTYPWTQQFPDASGAWTAGARTGTAYEMNGNTAVPTGTYIELERTPQGDFRFRSDSC